MGRVAVILYGYGSHLGNFEVFASSLAQTLRATYGRDGVLLKQTVRRDAFFSYLASPPLRPGDQIAELHVFAHSIGGGIFIAYGDGAVQEGRKQALARALKAGRRLSYQEVIDAEVGAILSDDFFRSPYEQMGNAVRSHMAADAFVKLWGCNSGVTHWVYSDGPHFITRPSDTSVPFYWRALNDRNVPKPAVAQAFAAYFGRVCYGATSGSHVEVLSRGHWESTARYRGETGQWPSGALIHRLQPDRGNYHAFSPIR
jgi:hypothetical protein